jgi:hypothetical protein
MIKAITRFGHAALLALVLFGFLRFLGYTASSFAFPFGGGEFHAMFAYTDAGRLSAAVQAFCVHTGALCLAASVLVLIRYPLSWRGVAAVTTAAGCLYWWDVVTWRPQSEEFHRAVLLLMPVIPLCAFGASAAVHGLMRRAAGAPDGASTRQSGRAVPPPS